MATYKSFFDDVRGIINSLEEEISNSQVVKMKDHILGEDDTVISEFEFAIEELLDNVTGEYGHKIIRERP